MNLSQGGAKAEALKQHVGFSQHRFLKSNLTLPDEVLRC